ncbi:oxygen-independent coproporphyrinogen III oxidase [Pseudoroseicyclus sp. H15]
MTHDRLRSALLTARVPRYTSYPPANHFTPEIGAQSQEEWLRNVNPAEPISLYVHVPFCRRLCWFCACRTQGTRTDAPLDRYLDHLEEEIALVRSHLPQGVPISALHLGGGTPTLLSPDRLARLGAMLKAAFPITEATEVSAEIDPTECDEPRLDALVELGLRRASVGVQDFDPLVQATIGREQSAEVTEAAINGLRARGVDSINVDLLYGLPYQTPHRLLATLARVLELGPDRIALYGYAHVPWTARRQQLIPEAALPTPEERLDLSALARATLVRAGYEPVGIDHFAKPGDSMAVAAREGTLHRNFQGYTTDRATTLVGLGPSAISRFAEGYVHNAGATGIWQAAVADGRLTGARGFRLSPADAQAGRIIEALMCFGTVDLAEHAAEPELEGLLATAGAALADMAGAGTLEGTRLTLADFAYARLIAQRFDTVSVPAEARFSQAC